MGDETLLIIVNTDERPTPGGMFQHWCEHPGCPAWGGFDMRAQGNGVVLFRNTAALASDA